LNNTKNILKDKRVFLCFFAYTLYFLLISCAAIQTPSGGPVDKTSPELIEVVPPSGTIHFKGGDIHLKFSEYLDESTLEKGFHIFPRLPGELEIRFKGDEIYVNIPDELSENQTYVITIGRELKDEHGVQLAEPVHLAYSTGDEISRGHISGRVYNEDNISVHLWKIQEDDIDSIFFSIPDYITDTTDDGFYRFEFLSPGIYQILSIGSEGAGYPLDTRRMRYGLYWKDYLEMGKSDTLSGINMLVQKEPQPLRLLTGEWNSSTWGRLTFNRSLPEKNLRGEITILTDDSSAISAEFFYDPLDDRNLIVTVSDSIKGETVEIQLQYLFQFEQLLLDSSKVKVKLPEIPDTSYLELVFPEKKLTIQPEMKNKPPVSLIFSKPIQIDSAFQNIVFIEGDSDSVSFVTHVINPLKMNVELIKDWKPNQNYLLQLVKNSNAGKMTFEDSLTNIHVQTENFIGYGNLFGAVEFRGKSELVAELRSLENPEIKWTSVVNSDSRFELVTIPEGHYFLMIFEDRDQDHKYTYGKAAPYSPSESFLMIPDTLEIRANWDIDLAAISFLGTF